MRSTVVEWTDGKIKCYGGWELRRGLNVRTKQNKSEHATIRVPPYATCDRAIAPRVLRELMDRLMDGGRVDSNTYDRQTIMMQSPKNSETSAKNTPPPPEMMMMISTVAKHNNDNESYTAVKHAHLPR